MHVKRRPRKALKRVLASPSGVFFFHRGLPFGIFSSWYLFATWPHVIVLPRLTSFACPSLHPLLSPACSAELGEMFSALHRRKGPPLGAQDRTLSERIGRGPLYSMQYTENLT